MKSRKLTTLFIGILSLHACYRPIPLKIPKPDRPQIKEVKVIHNCVCNEALSNLLDNWVNFTIYTSVLEKSGCFQEDSKK